MEKIPAYRQVYSALKSKIESGVYSPGQLLPSETDLCETFSVSRTTIRRAVGLLCAEGYLSTRRGKGTEVLDITKNKKQNRIRSFSETLAEKGFQVTTRGMSIEKVPAPSDVANALELSQGELVYLVQRIQCVDRKPVAYIKNYLKMNVVPNLESRTNTFTSLYSLLEDQYHIILKDAVESISARSASFTDSQILQVPLHSPLLYIKRITYTEDGPFEYTESKIVAEQYEYKIYLSGRN